MARLLQVVDDIADFWHNHLGTDDVDSEDYEASDDADDSDDEGRSNTNQQKLRALLDYLKEMDDEGISIVEALHCVNSWYLVEGLGVAAYHHGLVFKLSDDTFLRIHLVREGLAWRSYEHAPALPDRLVSSEKYKVSSRLAPLIPYCRDNAYWQWPNHDCEVFACGCLQCVGVTMPNSADKIMEFVNDMMNPLEPQPQQALPQNNVYTPMPKRQPALPQSPLKVPIASLQPPPIEHTAAKVAAEKRVKEFLREHGFKGTAANSRRRYGIKKYPLHTAVKLNDTQMVSLLLHFGADPRRRNTWGKTPYELACDMGNSEIMKMLSVVTF
jgi:hypothetical protein